MIALAKFTPKRELNNMYKNIFVIITAFFLLTLSMTTYADDTPMDQDGDLIPTPTGNFTYARLPQAMAAGNGKGTYSWTYMGSLINAADQQHLSFEGVISQAMSTGDTKTPDVATGVGFHTFQLGFKNGSDFFYVNSSYGGEDSVSTAMEQSLDIIQSKATLDDYFVTATPFSIGQPTWQIRSLSSSPVAPIFKGLLGQPGHQYQLSATGTTFLWHYDTNGHATVQQYRYKFSIDMRDERGVIGEGFGGGYVGAALAPINNKTGSTNADYEIGQPLLKAINWNIELQALNENLPTEFKSNYVFSGHDGLLWGDIGPLVSEPIQAIAKKLPVLFKQHPSKYAAYFAKLKDDSNTGGSLYNGNWIVMQLTQGKYKGAALTFVPFWNKLPIDPSNFPNTDDPTWCTDGFADLYTGILENDAASAYSIPEVLMPGNPGPGVPTAHWANPFTLRYLNMQDPAKYGLLYPWVQELEITVNPYSQIRFALAAYAHRQNPMVNDDVSKPVRIIVKTINPVTQNILFSKQVTQMYEGAATATINDEVVGDAWVEEMVGSAS